MSRLTNTLLWGSVSVLGAFALATIALHQGERINALWMVVVTLCVFLIAYRFYSRFIAQKVMELDASRLTPAVRLNDGLDYVPTNRIVLFGHHFAAIAGAGPLVGPVLAAQMGYYPGMLWLLAGVVLAGAVQDFMILFLSLRRDGKSLGEMIKSELGETAGLAALFGTFMIMVILLAVLALIVVKALESSPWGTFTVAATIPIALYMGVHLRYLRPGRIGEVSLLGFVLLIAAIVLGGQIAEHPTLAPLFTFNGTQLAWMLIFYGGVASVLPVWLLLAPRDYLSTFLKIGTIVALAVAIVVVAPEMKMPAITRFSDGTGPVWAGTLFPFLFITIACGAVSGFHSLIASGTTPKMVDNETNTRLIGYGAMLMESFVALMALATAACIDPGIYFAMNSPLAILGGSVDSAVKTITEWGFVVTPEMIRQAAQDVGEQTILARTGGAPTLAIGMAQIFAQLLGGKAMMGFWYHFAILFEAMFILTAVDAGTRAGRFMLQDLLGLFHAPLRNTASLPANLLATVICVGGWGYFLYQGVTDPFGGINTLWPLFGIANQMLAAVALILATTVLFKMKKERYVLVTAIPMVWLLITTFTAASQKLFHDHVRIGFFAHAAKYQAAIDTGTILAPAKSMEQMAQIVFNDRIDAFLTIFFMCFVCIIFFYGLRTCWLARQAEHVTTRETAAILAQPASVR
ncbi:MAG: carbon starvation protein A [Magnetococcales bacterium]|nr:carbon starvation protein A [Magnetococcales bacterium]